MRAKQFFYTSAGILLLVIAYSVGASRAQGQAQGDQIAALINQTTDGSERYMAVTTNGDVYTAADLNNGIPGAWTFRNNVFGNVASQGRTWSGVKQQYRK